MKTLLTLTCVALAVSACMVREERVVQPAPTTAAVVAPAPSAVVYTDTSPKTTTVYTR
ncbi:MAG: hypothetical protein K2X72_36435 [Reyranella sp.]|nr:hypothetical protein [Reyranella sp.]